MTTSLTSAAPPPVETKRAASTRPQRPRSRTSRYAVWFVGPFVVLFVGMYVAPIAFAIYKSMFRIQRDALGLGGEDPPANDPDLAPGAGVPRVG